MSVYGTTARVHLWNRALLFFCPAKDLSVNLTEAYSWMCLLLLAWFLSCFSFIRFGRIYLKIQSKGPKEVSVHFSRTPVKSTYSLVTVWWHLPAHLPTVWLDSLPSCFSVVIRDLSLSHPNSRQQDREMDQTMAQRTVLLLYLVTLKWRLNVEVHKLEDYL